MMNTKNQEQCLNETGGGARPAAGSKAVAVLGTGHFIVDLCQGVLPLTLPFLLTKLQLDYTKAALIVTTAYLTSSVAQPLFGFARSPGLRRATLWGGVPLACAGLALAALAPTYPALLLAVVLSSAGTAMYHPDAAARAHAAGGSNGAKSMSLFVMCGNVGFTTGAMIFGPLLGAEGLPAVYWLLIPGLLFLFVLRLLPADSPAQRKPAGRVALREVFRRMSLPVTVAALRQCAMAGLIAMLPLYFTIHLNRPAQVGGWMMFSLQLGSNCGMLSYGYLANHVRREWLLRGGLVLAAPALLLFPHTSGLVTPLVLFCAGVFLALPMMAITLLGQELLPENRALAASLILGLGIGLGGIASGLLGRAADHWGIETALVITGLMPLAAAAAGLLLPKPRHGSEA